MDVISQTTFWNAFSWMEMFKFRLKFQLELELEHSLFDKYKYTTCMAKNTWLEKLLSGVPDYFGRNKISSGGDLSHYSRASLY